MKIATPEDLGISSSRLKRITELTTSYIDKGNLAGTVSLVARRGEIVYKDCRGKMNLETGEPMAEDTIFRIHSMTKPITAAAIMLLHERGYFQLYTPITKFLPEFRGMKVFLSGTVDDFLTEKAKRDITFADLLTHTSGLTYHFLNASPVDQLYIKNRLNNFGADETIGEFIKRLSQQPLLFSPGEYWNYGLSYEVLGYLIEVVTGQPLDVFLKSEIFEPLGMDDTDYFVPAHKQDRLAQLYIERSAVTPQQRKEHPHKKLFEFNQRDYGTYLKKPKLIIGGGGLVSTASDYFKFSSMLLGKGRYGKINLLSSKSVELMTSNFLPSDMRSSSFSDASSLVPGGYGYGLGGAIMLSPPNAQMLGSPGEYAWSGIAHTTFFIDPKEELIGLFLTQVLPVGRYDVINQFKQSVYQALIN